MLEQGRIAVHDLGYVRVLALVGEHDLSTVDKLSDEVDRQLRETSHIVVDLTRATFVDSTIVCALALGGEHARARSTCRFAVVAPSGSYVRTIFDMIDLANVMATYETLEAALAGGGVRPAGRFRPV